MIIELIVAFTNDGSIGEGNQLLVHTREDMQYFRSTTVGKTVVMGRKTWESLPNGALPYRTNVVLTRDAEYQADGAVVMHSVAEVLHSMTTDTVIIGGGEIYRQFIPYVDVLHLSQHHVDISGDVKFPLDLIDFSQYNLASMRRYSTGTICAFEKLKFNTTVITNH